MTKYTEEEQEQLCLAWRRTSGISMKQFCRENKVSKSGLYKWLNKYDSNPVVREELKLLSAETEDSSSENMLELLLPNGVLVRGNNAGLKDLIRGMLQ